MVGVLPPRPLDVLPPRPLGVLPSGVLGVLPSGVLGLLRPRVIGVLPSTFMHAFMLFLPFMVSCYHACVLITCFHACFSCCHDVWCTLKDEI